MPWLPFISMAFLSLSARRAWIEILYYGDGLTFADGRSPQGERG